jgi:thiol-disulfide isomerase/thioredoxin
MAVVLVAGLVAALATGGGGGSSVSTASGGTAKPTKFEQAPVQIEGAALPKFVDSVGDPAVGQTIPTLTGKSVFDGSPVVVRPTGKPQAIVFLAHWCPHCQREVPTLVKLAKAGKLDGIDVTAVATATSPDAPNYPPSAWLKGQSWPYPVMADSTSYQAGTAFGLSAYPMFVLVDANGTVAGRSTGETSDADVVANV